MVKLNTSMIYKRLTVQNGLQDFAGLGIECGVHDLILNVLDHTLQLAWVDELRPINPVHGWAPSKFLVLGVVFHVS